MSFIIQKRTGLLILCVLIIIGLWVALPERDRTNAPAPPQEPVQIDFNSIPDMERILDFGRLEEDQLLSDLMKERKNQYGIDEGLDLIAKSNESIRVGDHTVRMESIIDETLLQKGELVEKNLGEGTAFSKRKKTDFGIHVVRPGENIWNIHFALLKNYFSQKQIPLPPFADEPVENGFSSGVGKILKFSENMVYIYNLKERRLESDIHTIQPLSKIVIYDLSEVFSLLGPIDETNVHRIRFDGDTLWITDK